VSFNIGITTQHEKRCRATACHRTPKISVL
jgi:hypothetical protein